MAEKNERMLDKALAEAMIRKSSEYLDFNRNVRESARVLEDSLSAFITKGGEDLSTNRLLNQTKDVIALSNNPLHTFHMLQNIRHYDDATFIHCLNVAIICHSFGKWLKLPGKDLDVLTLAGILHDVGKMWIPEEIIKKPGSLTDEEYSVIKMHPTRGYHILEPMQVDVRIKNVALMHHERKDGSGYPSGLRGDEIDEFARIVAIIDNYDAMTSARIYRGALCPFEVIEVLEEEGDTKFDTKYMSAFLTWVTESYVGSNVILSDGRKGRIIRNNSCKSLPVVETEDGEVDLSKEKDLLIKSIPDC